MTRKDYKRRIGSGFQKVDQRLLMAGDVDVGLSSGNDLYITGDAADNRIQVSTVNGQIRVSGISTTINNSTTPFEVNANVVDDIFIRMGSGDDWVQVNNVHLNNTTHGLLDIDTDDGNDLVGVYNSSARDLKLETDSGHDHAIVSYSAFGRDMDIDLGSGDDELDLYAAYAGDDIWVDAGSGRDDVALQGVTARDVTDLDMGDGSDVLWINGGTFGDLLIHAEGGNDRATVQNATITDDIYAHMGSGNDQLYLYGNSVADNRYFHGGTGNDVLSAGGNNFNAFATDYSF